MEDAIYLILFLMPSFCFIRAFNSFCIFCMIHKLKEKKLQAINNYKNAI